MFNNVQVFNRINVETLDYTMFTYYSTFSLNQWNSIYSDHWKESFLSESIPDHKFLSYETNTDNRRFYEYQRPHMLKLFIELNSTENIASLKCQCAISPFLQLRLSKCPVGTKSSSRWHLYAYSKTSIIRVTIRGSG